MKDNKNLQEKLKELLKQLEKLEKELFDIDLEEILKLIE